MRVSRLFLSGQSENVSFSLNTIIDLAGFFRSLLSPRTVIGLKLVKCVLARVFGVIYSLSVDHKPVRAKT